MAFDYLARSDVRSNMCTKLEHMFERIKHHANNCSNGVSRTLPARAPLPLQLEDPHRGSGLRRGERAAVMRLGALTPSQAGPAMRVFELQGKRRTRR